jgi:2-(1,2-epoxy-1,2-dihydrophenyl)acetyl-CoA isomerase
MSHIRVSGEGAAGIITIDRIERFNSLDVETARDLRKAGILLARDPAVRAIVLRGSGGVFCSGADLKYIRGGGDRDDLAYLSPDGRKSEEGFGEIFKQILEYLHSTISELRRAPKPVIAAVDGIAAAGGFGMAMACDLVIASERATFEWAYSRTGLTGAESSTFFLPRLVGLRRAMELVFLNPRLTAQQALEWGLVTAIRPVATFEADVLDVAEHVASLPTEAVAIAKELMNEAAGIDRLDFHLDRELEQLTRIAGGRNFAEGLDAFFARRRPQFT